MEEIRKIYPMYRNVKVYRKFKNLLVNLVAIFNNKKETDSLNLISEELKIVLQIAKSVFYEMSSV